MQPYVAINRDYWNKMAPDWAASGARNWALAAPDWGEWFFPEADLGLLPADMTGMAAIELGCGTGYVSGWMARRGARVTAIDIAAEQLATARRLAAEHGQTDAITFIEGNAESVACPDASFDFAISEYGAAIWCDPALWIPEAARLLRPGGRLAFLGSHPFVLLTTPPNGAPCAPVLHRPYRGLSRADWTEVEIEPGGIEFNLTFQGWLDLFRRTGLSVCDYRELYAPLDATTAPVHIPVDWAKAWPAEQVWVLEKR
ncbi:MAG: class I SAM-dependent methyltransferase [Pseudomonadota bacterium]